METSDDFEIVDFEDEAGIKRRVLVTPTAQSPEEGRPLSLVLDGLILTQGASPEFMKRLYNEFWALGLVTPADFLKRGAADQIAAALRAAYRLDVQSIQNKAAEELKRATS
jgi:hypothetical protein